MSNKQLIDAANADRAEAVRDYHAMRNALLKLVDDWTLEQEQAQSLILNAAEDRAILRAVAYTTRDHVDGLLAVLASSRQDQDAT